MALELLRNETAIEYILIITTDGSRNRELHRLFDSIPSSSNILVALLIQGKGPSITPPNHFYLIQQTSQSRIPLSVARNRLLEQILCEVDLRHISSKTRLVFSDDDCWYASSFFKSNGAPDITTTVFIHPAFDPQTNRAFAVKDLRRIPTHTKISNHQLLFCATSIGLDVPAIEGLQLRFNEKIGLGCDISQGEESLYLFHFLRRHPDTAVLTLADGPVFHPHKVATNSRNHYSLAYFLGWCGRHEFPFTFSYFFYKLTRSFGAIFFRPSTLSLHIFVDLIKGYLEGYRDTKRLGSPLSPNA